jgi:hypothetical protein
LDGNRTPPITPDGGASRMWKMAATADCQRGFQSVNSHFLLSPHLSISQTTPFIYCSALEKQWYI